MLSVGGNLVVVTMSAKAILNNSLADTNYATRIPFVPNDIYTTILCNGVEFEPIKRTPVSPVA